MQSQSIRHVRDLISLVFLFRNYLEWALVGIVEIDGGPRISCLD